MVALLLVIWTSRKPLGEPTRMFFAANCAKGSTSGMVALLLVIWTSRKPLGEPTRMFFAPQQRMAMNVAFT